MFFKMLSLFNLNSIENNKDFHHNKNRNDDCHYPSLSKRSKDEEAGISIKNNCFLVIDAYNYLSLNYINNTIDYNDNNSENKRFMSNACDYPSLSK